jgi:hypothetical protein
VTETVGVAVAPMTRFAVRFAAALARAAFSRSPRREESRLAVFVGCDGLTVQYAQPYVIEKELTVE